MDFYSAYNRPKTIYAPHGDEEMISYIEVCDRVTGQTRLEETDRMNISDYINSFLEETKIDTIIDRCMRGDTSALERMAGYYADVTNVPTSIAEIYSNLKRCEADFENLPAKMKEAFNNDPGQFIAGFGDGSVAEFLMQNVQSQFSDPQQSVVQNAQSQFSDPQQSVVQNAQSQFSDPQQSVVQNVQLGGNNNVKKSE